MTGQNPRKSLLKVIFTVCWSQRKWIGWPALIFLVFGVLDLYGLPPTKDTLEKPHLFGQEETLLVVTSQLEQKLPDRLILDEQAKNGFMGGPLVLGALVTPSANAAIDFSSDDSFEDYDSLLMQDNSLISSANPSGTAYFSNFRREIQTYIVKQGDVPEKIAISFDINSDTLLWANNLRDGDIIKPGQEIVILPINGVRIKVGAKDTVETLAKKYNGAPMEIIAFNDLPLEGTLKVGEYIIIPGGEMPAPVAPKYAAPKKYAGSTIPAGWLIWPTTGYNWGRLHGSNGVDIANACGTPIYAAASGKVILSDGVGWNGGYGKYIKILHPNSVITLYAHATKLLVSEGEQVAQGQVIALMGTTGRSTGCHLHFEVRGATNPLAR